MARIFISYRREDTAGHAAFFNHLLSQHFGQHDVFRDIDTIEPGMDFVEEIQREVASCSLLITIIGKQWLTTTDESGNRRIDNPNDFVRLEITTALQRNIRVIPALVHGARMPRADELPEDLVLLARRNAVTLHNESFVADTTRLIPIIEKVLQQTTLIDQAKETPKVDNTTKKHNEPANKPKAQGDLVNLPTITMPTEAISPTKTNESIIEHNQEQIARQTHLNDLSLLLKTGPHTSQPSEANRRAAASLTLTILPTLNPVEKGELLKFLYQEELITKHNPAIQLDKADLRGADLRGADLRGAILWGAILQKADFTEANLETADLDRADLTLANLRGAFLTKANLRGALLTEANLTGADFTEAKLWETDLRGADLREAILRGAHLEGADLTEAHNLTREQLAQATTNANTKLPSLNQ